MTARLRPWNQLSISASDLPCLIPPNGATFQRRSRHVQHLIKDGPPSTLHASGFVSGVEHEPQSHHRSLAAHDSISAVVRHWIQSPRAVLGHGRLFLLGPRRFGKTVILRAATAAAERDGAIVIRLDAEAYPGVDGLVRAVVTESAQKLPVLPESMRLMMRVSMSALNATAASRPQERVFIYDDIEPRPPLDGKTLSWRQKFVDAVKCLTAEEIAAECGHGAKNTSATASRWKEQGKIFAVKFKGRQLYPAVQFEHGEPRPVLQKILAQLPNDPTGWDRAYFFVTPSGYLNQKRPMDLLDEDSDRIVRVARRHSNPAEVC